MIRVSVVCVLLHLSLPQIANGETTFGSGVTEFALDFVTIPYLPPAPNVFEMSKYEISRKMIEDANLLGGLQISLYDMTLYGGNRDNMPATGVSWYEAARFVNWLNESKGYPPAYKFATQPGEVGYDSNQPNSLWESGDSGFNAANPIRNLHAFCFLPTSSEWITSAYYDPNNAADPRKIFLYPTGSDTPPMAVTSGTEINTAVFAQERFQGPSDVWRAGGLSPLGTMGQGGNVSEWLETHFEFNVTAGGTRMLAGGFWGDIVQALGSNRYYSGDSASAGNEITGFRVASVPEPSSALILASGLGLCCLALRLREPVE